MRVEFVGSGEGEGEEWSGEKKVWKLKQRPVSQQSYIPKVV